MILFLSWIISFTCFNSIGLYFYGLLFQVVTEVQPGDGGSVEVFVGKEGTAVKITFVEVPEETVSVGPVEVKACAEPGKTNR